MQIKTIIQEIEISVLATLVLAVLLCGLYPLVVWGVAQVAFPRQANGSLIEERGQVVGSSLIAQGFNGPQYFHPRPSAAGPSGYDAAQSGGSNLGPLSCELIRQLKERVEHYRMENGLSPDTLVPQDAVTASASGLDPHISLENAVFQASRVARARSIAGDDVRELIGECTDGPDLGFLGDPGVNVLKANLALDNLAVNSAPNNALNNFR
jgi:K+-transporting ATPase ATPase C chain